MLRMEFVTGVAMQTAREQLGETGSKDEAGSPLLSPGFLELLSSRQKWGPGMVTLWGAMLSVAPGDPGVNDDRWGRQRWAAQGPGRRCFRGWGF